MPSRRLLLLSLSLLSSGASLRLHRVPRQSPAPSPALCGALRVRGGGDESALQPKRDADLPLPTPSASAAPEGENVGCLALLSRLWKLFISFLSPSHDYARQDQSDLLGDPAQMSGFAPEDDSWRTQRKKLHRVELPPPARKRVLRDLRRLKAAGDELGIKVDDAECLTDWVVSMVGANNTIYEGELYRLRVRFHPEYPLRPPEVRFMRPAPVHEHIYSDGKICLNILYSDWDPQMDVKSMCLSLLSMLSSAKKKSRPPDNNQTVVLTQGQQAGSMQWDFHDDNC
eukprot:scaffold114905_cov32-Tisochrysis_lutea.AAC.1